MATQLSRSGVPRQPMKIVLTTPVARRQPTPVALIRNEHKALLAVGAFGQYVADAPLGRHRPWLAQRVATTATIARPRAPQLQRVAEPLHHIDVLGELVRNVIAIPELSALEVLIGQKWIKTSRSFTVNTVNG